MAEHSVEDLVARLERERKHADRLYNDALTRLDLAIQSAPALPEPPIPYDDALLPAINSSSDILPNGAPPIDSWLKGRLRAFIWRLVGPPLETQKRFNVSLVTHLNRNVRAHQTLPQTVAVMLDVVRREFEALVRFESLLVQYLQTITVYVDSKDRSVGGPELRERLALLEQRVLGLKRDVETITAAGGAGSAKQESACAPTATDASTYVGFEDRFRGPQNEIRRRVEDYVPILSAAGDVVDIGCGRGELLDLLKQQGVSARGIDSNAAMIEVCRARGLNVDAGDALGYLQRQPDRSIGGLSALQVVEHFEPAYLVRFLETAHHKMRPGAPLILETINPSCWMAFFETYLRDLTHQRPLHPDTLKYLVQASGFRDVDVQYRVPVSDGDKLAHVPEMPGHPQLAPIAAAINAHADTLNARLFSSMDYVVIARR